MCFVNTCLCCLNLRTDINYVKNIFVFSFSNICLENAANIYTASSLVNHFVFVGIYSILDQNKCLSPQHSSHQNKTQSQKWTTLKDAVLLTFRGLGLMSHLSQMTDKWSNNVSLFGYDQFTYDYRGNNSHYIMCVFRFRPFHNVAKRYVFVLTDGMSTERKKTKHMAQYLKDVATKVLAIGMLIYCPTSSYSVSVHRVKLQFA